VRERLVATNRWSSRNSFGNREPVRRPPTATVAPTVFAGRQAAPKRPPGISSLTRLRSAPCGGTATRHWRGDKPQIEKSRTDPLRPNEGRRTLARGLQEAPQRVSSSQAGLTCSAFLGLAAYAPCESSSSRSYTICHVGRSAAEWNPTAVSLRWAVRTLQTLGSTYWEFGPGGGQRR
jgi:hypothetical protein